MATPRTITPRPHPTAFSFTAADSIGLNVLTDDEVMARFDDRVDDQGGCEVWTGKLTNGQPRFWFSTGGQTGRHVLAVRMAWARVHGPIPDGYMVRHLCQTLACVKVEHLFLTLPVGNVHETQRQGHWHKTNLTACPLGHPYDGENLVLEADGSRKCQTCKIARQAAAYATDPDRHYDYRRARWEAVKADPERHERIKAAHRRWESAHRSEITARRRERRRAARERVTAA